MTSIGARFGQPPSMAAFGGDDEAGRLETDLDPGEGRGLVRGGAADSARIEAGRERPVCRR